MKRVLNTISLSKVFLTSAVLFFCFTTPGYAMDVTPERDPNQESDPAGYKTYYDIDAGTLYNLDQADYGNKEELPMELTQIPILGVTFTFTDKRFIFIFCNCEVFGNHVRANPQILR